MRRVKGIVRGWQKTIPQGGTVCSNHDTSMFCSQIFHFPYPVLLLKNSVHNVLYLWIRAYFKQGL